MRYYYNQQYQKQEMLSLLSQQTMKLANMKKKKKKIRVVFYSGQCSIFAFTLCTLKYYKLSRTWSSLILDYKS